MEFVGVLVFVTLVGMIFNAYFLILPSLVFPSLGMKKHQIRIGTTIIAIIICCLFPLSLFLIPSIIYTLNIFALCKSFSKGKGHKAVWIALEIFCLLLSPILAVYLFGFMFALDDYYYYLSLIIPPFWVMWIWSCLNLSKKIKINKIILHSTMAILLVLPTLTIYGYRHNPTVYGRKVSINRDGFKHIYWNEQILEHAKHVEQVIALDIIENYENVECIKFTDVYQNKYYFESPDSSNRFEVKVLINGKYKATYDVNLSAKDPNDPEDKYDKGVELYKMSSHGAKFISEKNNLKKDKIFTLKDLNNPKYQKQLKNIDITYYQKDDIYKIKKNN